MNNEGKTLEVVSQAGDAISLTVLFAYFVSALPTLALLFTVIWTGIRIYETDTFQQMFMRRDVKIEEDHDDEPTL